MKSLPFAQSHSGWIRWRPAHPVCSGKSNSNCHRWHMIMKLRFQAEIIGFSVAMTIVSAGYKQISSIVCFLEKFVGRRMIDRLISKLYFNPIATMTKHKNHGLFALCLSMSAYFNYYCFFLMRNPLWWMRWWYGFFVFLGIVLLDIVKYNGSNRTVVNWGNAKMSPSI